MNNIDSTIKNLAENFFQIIGLPISTMTVEEYKIFYSLAKEQEKDIFYNEKGYSAEDNIHKQRKIKESNHEENKKIILTDTEKKHPARETAQKPNITVSMLSMLQSVSG